MHSLRLYKIEKLCNEIAIDQLFRRDDPAVGSTLAFPLRCMWRRNAVRKVEGAQFLVSIPKKRLRSAVDRVKMRRRVREAYRLNRHLLPEGSRMDVAFVYVAQEVLPYKRVEYAVRKILAKMAQSVVNS